MSQKQLRAPIMCAYQRVRNVCLLENIVYFLFLLPPFWDLLFCFITDHLTDTKYASGINMFLDWIFSYNLEKKMFRKIIIFYYFCHFSYFKWLMNCLDICDPKSTKVLQISLVLVFLLLGNLSMNNKMKLPKNKSATRNC